MVGLGDLPGGAFESEADAVSADGGVIVGFGTRSNDDWEMFRWTAAGGMVGLGDLPGGFFDSQATGVSADGSVVAGTCSVPAGLEACRWTQAGGLTGLGDLPGGATASEARDISANGAVIVGFGHSASGEQAFAWTQTAGMVGLAGSGSSRALGVSADGAVVVGCADECSRAVYWSNGTQIDLETYLESKGIPLTGWALDRVEAVSDDGTVIAGHGFDPQGAREAFVAAVPEPEPLLMLGSGATLLAVLARRRSRRAG
jgi:probable HAF family extracellular repeat protein